nr:hypothetical protein [uncultured Rhodopila sp.]
MFNVKIIGADATTNSAGLAADLVVVAGPAKLFVVSVFNNSAGTLYLQAHDATAAPADGTAPKLCTPVFTSNSGGFGFVDGAIFKAGIYLCFSSTAATKTVAAGTPGLIDATYRRTS